MRGYCRSRARSGYVRAVSRRRCLALREHGLTKPHSQASAASSTRAWQSSKSGPDRLVRNVRHGDEGKPSTTRGAASSTHGDAETLQQTD
jgi:hypothetical protein